MFRAGLLNYVVDILRESGEVEKHPNVGSSSRQATEVKVR